MKDGDEEEEGIGTTRYPCIPSLVAQLQMKNRLHLAMLGKKLMKWTALATTKELRRITVELVQVHANYGNLIREAYIELARCRYFCPFMNQMVIESPPMYPETATITVMTSFRSVTGSKVIHYEPTSTDMDNYQYLALPLGGIEIAEAKRKWRELLYVTILLVELKKNFITIETARNSANKKSNVLGKIVIPRINLTIKYITSELDEKAREDFYRMKKIIKVKEKYRKKKEAPAKVVEDHIPELEHIVPQPVKPSSQSAIAFNEFANKGSVCPRKVDSSSPCKVDCSSPCKVDSGISRKVEFDSPKTQESPRSASPAPSSPCAAVCAAADPSLPCTAVCTAPAPAPAPVPAPAPAPAPAPGPAPASDNTILRDVETKQITKVTRITRPDGTVVEEIKTIKISKEL